MDKGKLLVVFFLTFLLVFLNYSKDVNATPGEEVPLTGEVSENVEQPSVPLTPEGNLTLVDDIGDPTKAGKQFITLVTKNGNYFYLIIDRDDEGESTVHFLNQVDEADLLALTKDQSIEHPIINATEQDENEEKEKIDPQKVPTVTVTTDDKANNKIYTIIGVLGLIVIAFGSTIIHFMRKKKEKQNQEQIVDPDDDYDDDYIEDEEILKESE